MEILKQQFKYYKERAREEERIRSIYHDMKNHLLILQAEQTRTKGTKDMIQSLQEQLAEYDNYIHTGNSVLDIIIRDKSRDAQDNNIDFSAVISFQDSNFIDPLDISTIYGNALDNAIEACAELPPEERLITVKTNRIHDMLSIIIENTMGQEWPYDLKTNKSDTFLHGFGLSNIKKAVVKYQGECVTKQKNGLFTLTIIIPISA
ncbi:MAG TPA: sensor histidine kinase [Candidatus Pelethocola excrementipullorum]|nr:sensor histidine kinase [Candidatus Pelethocola excrementipullorum]